MEDYILIRGVLDSLIGIYGDYEMEIFTKEINGLTLYCNYYNYMNVKIFLRVPTDPNYKTKKLNEFNKNDIFDMIIRVSDKNKTFNYRKY
jgi:hypothetical protein